jgi:hypothetical protein
VCHFIQYHKVDKKNPSFRDREPDFRARTKKPVGRELAGSTVWLISGEGRPPEHRLEYRFTVDGVEPPGEDGRRTVCGSKGTVFPGGVLLTGLLWFESLRERMADFRSGFAEIPEKYVRHLQEAENRANSVAVAGAGAAETGTGGPAGRRTVTQERIVRDSGVTASVKELHNHRCRV